MGGSKNERGLILLIAMGFIFATVGYGWAQAKDIKWGTSAADHRTQGAGQPSRSPGQEMPNYKSRFWPTPGAIVSVKGYATGQFDAYYGPTSLSTNWPTTSTVQGLQSQYQEVSSPVLLDFFNRGGSRDPGQGQGEVQAVAGPLRPAGFHRPLPWDVRAHWKEGQPLGSTSYPGKWTCPR